MHGLHSDDIQYLSPLLGAELIQICVGEFDLQFRFHPSAFLSVEGRCEMLLDSDTVLDFWDRGTHSDSFRFLQLLGLAVLEVVIDRPNSFKLAFSQRRWLRVIDNSDRYESFSIGGWFV